MNTSSRILCPTILSFTFDRMMQSFMNTCQITYNYRNYSIFKIECHSVMQRDEIKSFART